MPARFTVLKSIYLEGFIRSLLEGFGVLAVWPIILVVLMSDHVRIGSMLCNLQQVFTSAGLAGLNVEDVPDDGVVLGGQLLEAVVQVRALDHLDEGHNIVLGTEVYALLCLRQPSDQGASDALLVEHEGHLDNLGVSGGHTTWRLAEEQSNKLKLKVFQKESF